MEFLNKEKQILTTSSSNDENDSKKILNMMLTIDNTIDDSDDMSFNESNISSRIFEESDSEIDFNQLDSTEDVTQSDINVPSNKTNEINTPDSNKSLFNVDGFIRNIYEMKYETEPDKIKWPFKESDLDIKPWQTKYEQKYDELVKTNDFLQKK